MNGKTIFNSRLDVACSATHVDAHPAEMIVNLSQMRVNVSCDLFPYKHCRFRQAVLSPR